VQSKGSFPKKDRIKIIAIPLKGFGSILPIIFTGFLSLYLPVYLAFSRVSVIVIDPYIHIVSLLPNLLLTRLKKIKIVLDIRSTPVETKGFRGFLRKFWFNISIHIAKNFFNGATIITPLMRDEVCQIFEMNPQKFGTWSSGVDIKLFNPSIIIREALELKRSLGLLDKFVVFYHGVLTATRGLEETVRGIAIIKSEYPNVVVFFLGSGPMESKLKQIANSEGLGDNMFIHGPVDQAQVPKYIHMSDVCIVPLPNHPYWRSQSPLKLLEYLSMEKVVILTDIPAHRLIVGSEKCAIYISSIVPNEISNAIKNAYISKDALNEWGKIGREIVKNKFTWAETALDLETYLLTVKNKEL
jgi:glycosyltransferase involved in cell wall biosynthesis